MYRFFAAILCLAPFFLKAQVASYNQYSAALAGINPAYIACVDRDQLSMIFRDQWPGYKQQSLLGEFSVNRFSTRFSSSIGLFGSYKNFNQESSDIKNAGLQYGYRVYFLNSVFLNFGLGVTASEMNVDINNVHYKYDPKASYTYVPGPMIQNRALRLSYGLIIQEESNGFYGGISVRDHAVYTMLDGIDAITVEQNPTLSLQGMYRVPITRKALFFAFGSYEKTGKLTTTNLGKETILQPSFHYMFLQGNFYHSEIGSFGIGYKAYFGNYGSTHLRYSLVLGPGGFFTLGYSHDAKPYIQYDRIRLKTSHEVSIKIKLLAIKTKKGK